jgi:hypothetical protein
MKYVIFDEVFPILFDDPLIHSTVAQSYQGEATSAGFCTITNDKVFVWGSSTSLNGLKSQGDDSQIIEAMLNRKN